MTGSSSPGSWLWGMRQTLEDGPGGGWEQVKFVWTRGRIPSPFAPDRPHLAVPQMS